MELKGIRMSSGEGLGEEWQRGKCFRSERKLEFQRGKWRASYAEHSGRGGLRIHCGSSSWQRSEQRHRS